MLDAQKPLLVAAARNPTCLANVQPYAMTDYSTLPDRGLGATGTVLLLALAVLTVWSTWSLATARAGIAESIGPELEAMTEVADQVAVDGAVLPQHPVLPEHFEGMVDELLASPMLHHPEFAEEVDRWVGRWSSNFSRWMPTYLERMTAFEVIVDTTLSAHDLPWSLRYLPVIESGYSPTAVSSASAVGMWQFMAPTARDLGLDVDDWVDDRRDPLASTAAAADYLVQLRGEFDSWFLALAAYNAGPDRVKRLIDRYLPDAENSDAVYWALRRVLPKETADFVPNLIGAIIVASDPTAYGYESTSRSFFEYDPVAVTGAVSFTTAARAAGTTTQAIAALNPEYLRRTTPPRQVVELRLPLGTGAVFRRYFEAATDR
jgi:membrane-bound lytic murein transglycosylase D